MNLEPDNEYMGYRAASKWLGLKIGTVYSLVSRDVIPHIRITPRMVLFSKRHLQDWLGKMIVPPREEKHA